MHFLLLPAGPLLCSCCLKICVLSKANPSLDLLQTCSLAAYSSKNSCYHCLLGSNSKFSFLSFSLQLLPSIPSFAYLFCQICLSLLPTFIFGPFSYLSYKNKQLFLERTEYFWLCVLDSLCCRCSALPLKGKSRF